MKITVHHGTKPVTPCMPASQLVNKLGKYLYKNLDGAVKYDTSSNTSDVYTMVLYQAPGEEMQEMILNISLTTYMNKVRVNVIEVSPRAKTIGFDVYPPEQLQDFRQARTLIYHKVCKRIQKEYQDYEFLF